MQTSGIKVTLIDSCGTDLSVVNAARVSFEKESDWITESDDGDTHYDSPRLADRDAKLISYLARHQHTSPFNHCFASFRVKAPIFVARQLVKHKFLPWNEVSRRYVDSEPEFYIPHTWRKRAENVKQGSSEETADLSPICSMEGPNGCLFLPAEAAQVCLETYQALLDVGVCPEQARMVLPQNTMTEWIWSGTLGAWADMCKLRLDAHAQKETQEVAKLISQEMKNLFPVSWQALLEV